MPDHPVHPASYRDPSGFVFQSGSLYYRQVNKSYASDYEELLRSGLYEVLTQKGLLLPHTEIGENLTGSPEWYKTLLPRQVPFISYPSEWSPAQLKDAALLTLRMLAIAMEHGMIIKDATPSNIQFIEGKPVFIDTLSFEKYDAILPWVAYRQFCECMLFPLYLHHYLSTGTHWIMSAWPEGIPAEITARLLPLKSRLRLGVWLHVWLQSRVQRVQSTRDARAGGGRSRGELDDAGRGLSGERPPAFSKEKLIHLVNNLRSIVSRLKTDDGRLSVWNNYYESTISSRSYLEAKEKLFREFIGDLEFGSALDLGANDGYFSRILAEALAEKARAVLAVDGDWQCINRLYESNISRAGSSTPERAAANILPLYIDIANPTPATGLSNAERASFSVRAPSDLVAALALVHHLVFGKNIPLSKIAASFSELSRVYLVIEFIPLTDEKVRELIRNRKNFHSPYDAAAFEAAFAPCFTIEKQAIVPGTERILYLMKKKSRQHE